MDWIADHIQLVIAAAAAFAYWLNARKQQEDEDAEPTNERQFRDESQEAAEEAERARRIREEIRRKITERSSGGSPQVPRPVAGPPPLIPTLDVDPPVFAPETPRQPLIDTAMLEQQRRLREQLEEAARTKRRAQEIRQGLPGKRTKQAATAPALAGGGLRADLQNRASLRRAVVLREVLGPPVGLR